MLADIPVSLLWLFSVGSIIYDKTKRMLSTRISARILASPPIPVLTSWEGLRHRHGGLGEIMTLGGLTNDLLISYPPTEVDIGG